MARNIEVKARCSNLELQQEIARKLSAGTPQLIEQEDVFFEVKEGRLKLRIFGKNQGELISYNRQNQCGPKLSDYVVVPVLDCTGMRAVLSAALGEKAVLRKLREFYQTGRARIHIDHVEELGDFIEIEVVLQEGEDMASGMREAHEIMEALNMQESDLIDVAYIDLLREHKNGIKKSFRQLRMLPSDSET